MNIFSRTLLKTILLSTATLALGASLNACSSAPVTVPLDPVEFTLPLIPPTAGAVIFASQAAKFQSSPVSFSTVSIAGNGSATGVSADIVANVYASATNPAGALGCLPVGDLVVCLPTGLTKITSQSVTFKKDASKTAFKLEDNNGVLKAAITSGKVWVGIQIESGFASNSKVSLSDMVASLAVF
jgi:hypothetical protein